MNTPNVPFSAESSIFIEIPRKWKGFELMQPETVCKERSRVARSNLSATAADANASGNNYKKNAHCLLSNHILTIA